MENKFDDFGKGRYCNEEHFQKKLRRWPRQRSLCENVSENMRMSIENFDMTSNFLRLEDSLIDNSAKVSILTFYDKVLIDNWYHKDDALKDYSSFINKRRGLDEFCH